MKESAGQFLKELSKVALSGLKYLLVSVLFSLAVLSFVTGKFPPPIKEFYQTLSQFQSSMNISKAGAQIAKAKIDQDAMLKKLDEDSINAKSGTNEYGNPTDPLLFLQKQVKSLEYEIALLKSKLNRAESESDQLKAQLDLKVKK